MARHGGARLKSKYSEGKASAFCGFNTSLIPIASSRLARATWWDAVVSPHPPNADACSSKCVVVHSSAVTWGLSGGPRFTRHYPLPSSLEEGDRIQVPYLETGAYVPPGYEHVKAALTSCPAIFQLAMSRGLYQRMETPEMPVRFKPLAFMTKTDDSLLPQGYHTLLAPDHTTRNGF